MSTNAMPKPAVVNRDNPDVDAIVIGAGFGGLRMLYDLSKEGFTVRAFETGSDVGGTWYWNRYPGARTDTEAWAYCFSFSKELTDEWDWPERMPSQQQVQRYLRHVAERFELLPLIEFNTRINTAKYDDKANIWTVTTEKGESTTCRYLISATGLLSHACEPQFEGLKDFGGDWYLSSRWPKKPVDFAGKRVAIVGTGSTGTQMLPVISQTASHVTVFQRTPNYVLPGRNHPLDDAQRHSLKSRSEAIWKQIRNHSFAFPVDSPQRFYGHVTDAERQNIFEAGWETGGFRFVFETFDDILVDERSNEAAAEFVRRKIRAIVRNPKTAAKLCPSYPIFAKRPPITNFYFESFNRDNVSLVDLRETPIVKVTKKGIQTSDREHEFDIIVFALGFDAGTGALTHMDIQGKSGQSLKDKWQAGPRTYLGIMADDFPNFFMISGPQSAFANLPPTLDGSVGWITTLLTKLRASGNNRAEAGAAPVSAWIVYLKQLLDATLIGKGETVNAWHLGANIEGKAHSVLFYFGGAPAYFRDLQKSIDTNFEGIAISKGGSQSAAGL